MSNGHDYGFLLISVEICSQNSVNYGSVTYGEKRFCGTSPSKKRLNYILADKVWVTTST